MGGVRRRWDGEPRRVRWVVGVCVAVLVYGTLLHVLQLITTRLAPYPDVPVALRVYFVSLTVLDPLAAALLAARRRAGVALTVAVLVTDAVGNAWAAYVVDTEGGVTPGRVGQAVVSVLAVAAVLSAPMLWRSSARGRG